MPFRWPVPLPATPERRFRWVILGFSLVTVAALAGYWWQILLRNEQVRRDTAVRTEQVARQLAGGVAEQMKAVIRGVDFALLGLREDYLHDRDRFTQSVAAALAAYPPGALPQVGVIGADGYLIYSNRSVAAARRIFLGDRPHFLAHAQGLPQDRLFISNPVSGRVSGAWSIQFSRPIYDQGRFVGVMVLSVSPEYLSAPLASLSLGASDSAGLVSQDGSYLARSHDILHYLGKRVADNRPYLHGTAAASGLFHGLASHEAVRRTFAWRRLEDWPLTIFVGLGEAEIFDPVEQELARGLLINGLGSLGVVIFALVIIGLMRRSERQRRVLAAQESLYRAMFEKNASVKLLVDGETGQIVAANQAACDFYGYGRPQLEAMNIAAINCQGADAVADALLQARTERQTHFLFPHRMADGRIRQVEVYAGPLDMFGRQLVYSIVHDVTERWELEKQLKTSEARYRTLFQAIPEGMMIVSRAGKITHWNAGALSLLNMDEAGLQTRQVRLFHRDGRPVRLENYPSRRALDAQETQGLFFIELADNRRRWLAVSTCLIGGGDGPGVPASDQEDGAVVCFSDITRLVALEESLMISQSVFEAAAEGILVTGADAVIQRVNPAFVQLTGYTPEEVIGLTPAILASGQHDASFYQAMYEALHRDGRWEGEVTNRRKDGSLYVGWLKISAIRNKDDVLVRYVALFSDVTLRKQKENDAWYQAHHDLLTQLPNRILFLDRLQQALTRVRRYGGDVAVLFVDLDRFKPVNDTYGHLVGDRLLQQVGQRLRRCCRGEDSVARMGGDEFVVLLPELHGREDAAAVADKIRLALETPFHLGEVTVEISASVGIALYPADGEDPQTLLDAADAAMYRAKSMARSAGRALVSS